jgi:hypothetical protein
MPYSIPSFTSLTKVESEVRDGLALCRGVVKFDYLSLIDFRRVSRERLYSGTKFFICIEEIRHLMNTSIFSASLS